jgi:phosphohistidine phosphatase
MYVYLVQHGEAKPKDLDPDRSLTDRGRAETERVAAHAARMKLDVHQIWHSGRTRAEQTAAIFGEALSPVGGVASVTGLAPNDDAHPVSRAVERESRSLMLVGHMPFMARLVGLLLTSNTEQAPVKFRNSAIVCLTRDGERWQVAWILTPEMAGPRQSS